MSARTLAPARMLHHGRAPGCVAMLVLAGWGADVSGQRVVSGLHVQSFSMAAPNEVGLERATLLVAPWSVTASTSSVAISVEGAWADASLSAGGGVAHRAGLTDSRVRLGAGWRAFDVRLSATLPTGNAALTMQDLSVAGMLTSDLLPFAVSRLSGGFGLSGDLEYRLRVGSTSVGAGGGYATFRELPAVEALAAPLTPGWQLRARAMVEHRMGNASVLTFLAGMQRFGADRFDGVDLIVPGMRTEGTVSLALPIGARESAMMYAGFYHRGSARIAGTPSLESTLPGASIAPPRMVIVAGVEGSLDRNLFGFAPNAEVRLVRTPSGVGQGWLASLGALSSYRLFGDRLGAGAVLRPRAALRFGRVIADASAKSDVIGWEAGLSLDWSLGW